MKKIILSLSLLVALSVSSLQATANVDPVKDPEQTFRSAFPAAQSIKWSREGNYRKVSFVLYGRGAQASFSAEGDLLGTMRNVLYADLPIKVMIAIKQRFENAVPFALTEISKVDGTTYKFSVEVKSRRYDATVSQDGSFNKIEKR